MTAEPTEAEQRELYRESRQMVAALIRRDLRAAGNEHLIDRLRDDHWTLRYVSGTFLASWPDGTPIGAYDEDTVAAAVGLLRAKHDALRASLN